MRSVARICPQVRSPFEECYVNDLGSGAIEKAVYYCGGHFEECEIYARRHTTGEAGDSGDDRGPRATPAKP